MNTLFKILFCLTLSFVSTCNYALNTPTDFPELVLWLDANDSATLFSNSTCTTPITTDADVGCWHDKSGSGNHVIQTTVAMPNYRLNQQNGMPALEFVDGAGNDDRLATTTAGQITANGSYTKFVVFSYDSLTTSNNLISSAGSTGTAFWGSNAPNNGRLHVWNLNGTAANPGHLSSPAQLTAGQYYIGATRYNNIAADGNLSVLNIDGTQVANDDTLQNHTAQVISIGNHNDTSGLDGRIAEAIVYNRTLTDMEIDCVEAYLGDKWNIATPNAGTECTAADSLTLDKSNYPEFKIFQRDDNNHYSFDLSGSFVGTCTAVEASFNSATFTTIDVAPAGGVFSGTLANQTTGQGNLSIRCANNTTLNDSVANIGIGDVYVVAGQSNAEGRALNQQVYIDVAQTTSIFPTVFSQDNVWFIGDDDTDPTQADGSVWPIVGGYIVENTDVPVAFITVSTGATALVNPPEWQKGGATCNGALNCYAQMTTQVANSGVNAVKAILWLQGESDAFIHTVSQVAYRNAFEQFVTDVQADIAGPPEIVSGAIGQWIDHNPFVTPIRLAIIDAWDSNPAVLFGPQAYDIEISNDGTPDNVHFINNAEVQTLAFRWWKALEQHYYGGTSGRGPVISAANATVGASEIVLTFTNNSSLAPNTLSTVPWLVNDNAIAVTVTSANVTASNKVTLSLNTALTSQNVSITYAIDATGEGNALTDSTTGNILAGTSPLPADPFNDYPVVVSALGPNLTLTIDDGLSNLSQNQALSYNLTIENAGNTLINNAIVETQIAKQLTDIQWTCIGNNGATCPTATGAGDLSLRANFPIDSSLVYTINANVSPFASGDVTSMATVFMPFGIIDMNSDDNFNQDIDPLQNILFSDSYEDNNSTSTSAQYNLRLHEDAEDGNIANWEYYATTLGSTATNVLDDGGHAIELSGNNGLNNGFSFSDLNIEQGFIASWRLKYSNAFRFFAIIRTSDSPNANMFLEYTPDDISTGQSGVFIHHGLGANANDGSWHTFTRDLEADLHATRPNDNLLRIVGFSIRGSGRIDNILTYERPAQETFIYHGHNYQIIKTPMNWQDAAAFADNAGGYLANIGSVAENHEIYSRLYRYVDQAEYANTVASNGGGASYIWIGGNDLDTPDTWIWDNNGEQFWNGKVLGNPVGGLYNNWGRDNNEIQNEPDNAGIQQSAGIALTRWPIGSGSLGQTSHWNDLISADPLYFIIEFD